MFGNTILLPPGTVLQPFPSTTSTPCDPQLARQRGQLYAKVATGIYNAERAIEAGPAVVKQNASAFMRLAAESRELGRVEGRIEACKPTGLSHVQIRTALAQNQRDLLLLEARLNQAWLQKDYRLWMTLRASVQKFHRFVARNQVWLAKAQAVADNTYADPDVPPEEVVETPPEPEPVVVEPVEDEPIVDAEPMPPPLYKRPVFWGAVAAIFGVGVGVYALTR